jgi:hypothetical protein
MAAVVVGSGAAIAPGGAGGGTGEFVVGTVPEGVGAVDPPGPVVTEGVDAAGLALLPWPPEETTTPAIAPAPATTATPAASRPFLTRSEATLAEPWRKGSKSN